ncbi:MAG TPA: hypothetical protein VFF26_11840 [Gallionella sp.]|nr:hypothetical protein [Gallionella sp.]
MKEIIKGGTKARNPDLDWSQLRETILMLELAAGQIEHAMKDSNTSVEVLTDSFTTMAGYLHSMSDVMDSLPDEGVAGEKKAEMQRMAGNVTGMVQQSIIAFQFYDKLTQRLTHVCHSLAALNDLVDDRSRLYSPNEWVALQEKIRSKYTTPEEHALFDAVMEGVPVQEALDRYMSNMKDKGDDIELF